LSTNVPIDAVLSHHLNPHTCGVAKFNIALAQRLGVPCLPMSAKVAHPLVSVKPSELYPAYTNAEVIQPIVPFVTSTDGYDVLLHGEPPYSWQAWLQAAGRVWRASDVGCPSTIDGPVARIACWPSGWRTS
jgi:hypothetical protein